MKKLFGLLAAIGLLFLQPLGAHAQTITNNSFTRSTTGNLFDVSTRGYASYIIQWTGTYSGVTVVYEYSADPAGSNWFPAYCFQADTAAATTSGSTVNKGYVCPVLGARFRARITAISSGAPVVYTTAFATGTNPASLTAGGGGGGGDASAANQVTGNASLSSIDSKESTNNTQLTAINANTDTLEAITGLTNDTACTTDTATCTINARLQRIAQRNTTLITAFGSSGDTAYNGTTNLTAMSLFRAMADQMLSTAAQAVKPQAQTTGGCTPVGFTSAASNNATLVSTGAHTLCGGQIINTTATLYYLRLYDTSASPTCSSATGYIASIPIPASTSGNGTIINPGAFGAAFSNGLSYCFTGGASSTDNTSAATGVFGLITYK